MIQFTIQISHYELSTLLQNIFKRLPKEYGKALKAFLKLRATSFFRESLISKWIPIPTKQDIIFKNFATGYRLANIFIDTNHGGKTELQVYLNQHGIFGINCGGNLHDLLIDTLDTKAFVLEGIPVSKFYTHVVGLEYLDSFNPIKEYLDSPFLSEVYTINETEYFSIIHLSDEKCIAIDEVESVFLLNKETGNAKMLFKRPGDFVEAVGNGELGWLN